MLMREVSSTISATMQAPSRVDISMLPHVIGRRVVLATHDADVTLLPVSKGPEAEALGSFGCSGGWGDLLLVDDVVGVVVRYVVVLGLQRKHQFCYLLLIFMLPVLYSTQLEN